MVHHHRIHLRPKRTKRDDWALGWFRMIAQDIEGIIKDFDDQWKQEFEYTTPLQLDTAQTNPFDKNKDKVETKTQDAEDLLEEEPKKKKQKVTKPSGEIKLTPHDYEQIAARIKDRMSDTFQVMRASQGKLQGAID